MADEIKTQEETPEVYEKPGFLQTVVKAAKESWLGQKIAAHKKGLKAAAIAGAILGAGKMASDWTSGRGLFSKPENDVDGGVIEDWKPGFSENVQDISWAEESSAEE